MAKQRLTHPILLALVCALVGILVGVGGYTFIYANGSAYLSNDPQACVNCHIMRTEFDGWQKASHHAVATCNDCHVPHTLVEKYLTKMENGYNHSRAFTFQDFHEPIEMRPQSKAIVLNNCLECHKSMVSNITQSGNHLALGAQTTPLDCIPCHRGVGHGTMD